MTNFASIRQQQALSFVASALNDGSALELPLLPDGAAQVVPAIGIYGANASGKSTVLAALTEFRNFVSADPRTPGGRQRVPHDPFLLDPAWSRAPTGFEMVFVVDQVRYEYGIEVAEESIHREWLHAFPHGRRQTWFDRESGAVIEYRFPGDHLKGARSKLVDLTAPEIPFIALGAATRHPQLTPLVQWLRRFVCLGPGLNEALGGIDPERLASSWGPRMERLAARADLGIVGAEIVEVDPLRAAGHREVRLRHAGPAGAVSFPPDRESDGTSTWLELMVSVLKVIEDGGVLVVDELDRSLHPDLTAEVVRMFNDRALNQHRAQVVFATHDTTLLDAPYGAPVLDRDQVWFTEKARDGATELFPVTAFKPRKRENLERGYRHGRYGAVPDLSPGELARVLMLHRADPQQGTLPPAEAA
jgi:hypothetical protein